MNEEFKIIKVLLVEDDPEDVELTMEEIKMTKIKLDIDIASDGIDALEKLEELYKTDKYNLPDNILLDLNMPRMNGHEVLQKLKADQRFKKIPVVILTINQKIRDK